MTATETRRNASSPNTQKFVPCRLKQSPCDNFAHSKEHSSKAATYNISVTFHKHLVEIRRAVEVIYGVLQGGN